MIYDQEAVDNLREIGDLSRAIKADHGVSLADLLQFTDACEKQDRTPSDVIAELIRDYAQLHAPKLDAA